MNSIIKKHIELQKRYAELEHYSDGFNPVSLEGYTVGKAYDYVKEHSFHLNQEIQEVMEAVAKGSTQIHKPWSKKNPELRAEEYIPTDHIREEAIDAMCFMMNIMLACGVNENNIDELYEKVYQKNKKRQENDY